MRRIGLDEAGYGPNLGPLVLAAVTLRWVGDETPDWVRLEPATESSPVLVGDSKKILNRAHGAVRLAETVHAALAALCQEPTTVHALIQALAPEDAACWQGEPWSAISGELARPDPIPDLKSWLDRQGVTLERIAARVVFPPRFNAGIQSGLNKAEFHASQVVGLLREALCNSDERTVANVDRLGGRKFYRSLVEDLAGEVFPHTIEETSKVSRYRFERGHGKDVEIAFRVGADGSDWCVALASMVAKYVRESCMAAFNSFWTHQIPGLVPTAGYPVDAARFLKDIAKEREHLGIPIESIWRVV